MKSPVSESTVAARVKADVSAADPTSSKPITTTIPMTQAEWQKSSTMFETLYPLLQILEMRGAINIRASEAVVKVVNADDANIVYEDAAGLAVDPATIPPGTEVVVLVATGRPCA